jgi:hypothetical protein
MIAVSAKSARNGRRQVDVTATLDGRAVFDLDKLSARLGMDRPQLAAYVLARVMERLRDYETHLQALEQREWDAGEPPRELWDLTYTMGSFLSRILPGRSLRLPETLNTASNRPGGAL